MKYVVRYFNNKLQKDAGVYNTNKFSKKDAETLVKEYGENGPFTLYIKQVK